MADDYVVPPTADELEVSLFGPGYGESIVIHAGNNQWILVDSCMNPRTKQPAALSYLRDLNVDASKSVRLIVATHWHDDHVRGIAATFKECESAKLAISGAVDKDNFLNLLAAYTERRSIDDSGLNEFLELFAILKQRKESRTFVGSPQLANANKLLYKEKIVLTETSIVDVEAYSLSPSDESIVKALLSIGELLPAENISPLRIPSVTPNYASVVVWIRVGDSQMLLGADLQKSGDPAIGWTAILTGSIAISGKADVFKIPHHGSQNGDEPRVWSELLNPNPLAVLTPFTRANKRLPTLADIQRISSSTSNGYITAAPTTQSPRWNNRVIRDTLRDATRSVHPVNQGWGQVRLRRKLNVKASIWQTALFGNAQELAEMSTRTYR